ncbi:unnamed protein product [Phytomonas sp. EM1]|nr:unnamed protein product [Phytomonas sp. EM1]|eukprot:CCW59721.1 unnamed protein product [Phytomonas sp. isolate EM1]
MNSDTIYVFDPITSVASHSGNSEGVLYVPAPHSTSTGPALQLVQGTMLPPVGSASPDSVPSGSHVLSVNAYPVSYAVVPSSNQAYDVNRFDLTRYATLGGPIPTTRQPFAHSFAPQGQSPSSETVPLFLLGPLGQEQQPSPNRVNSAFTPGFAYLEPPYMGASSPMHSPNTAPATASASTRLNLMPNIDQSCLTMVPVSASPSAHHLLVPPKMWDMPKTSLSKLSEPVSPSKPMGLCRRESSSNFPYPKAKQPSGSSTASVERLNSPTGASVHTKFPLGYHTNRSSFTPKEGKQFSRFMGVRGFLAPPPLGTRIVPGTTALLDIPPLALPEPRWGILPQAALLAE